MTGPEMLESQRVRQEIRAGRITGTSRGLAHGFVQCNLAILPKEYAFDFLLYCQRNQRACPVLEVTDPGSPMPKKLAPGTSEENQRFLDSARNDRNYYFFTASAFGALCCA